MAVPAIVEVCVYRQDGILLCNSSEHGVELTRLVKYNPSSVGPQTIRVPIEQNDVDMATVKVESSDSTFAVLDIGLTSKLESYEEKIGRFDRAAPLYSKFKDLTRQKAAHQLALRRLQIIEEHVNALPEECRRVNLLRPWTATPSVLGDTYMQKLEKLVDASTNSHVKLCDEKFKLTKELEKVDADLQKCQQALYDLCSAGLRLPDQLNVFEHDADWRQKYEEMMTTFGSRKQFLERYEIVVTAEVVKIEPIEFKIRYSTHSGYWSAAYDLKIKSKDLSTLEVFYYAQIQQDSSEDWKNVDLTISTGKISTAGAPPALPISVVRPEDAKFMIRESMGAMPCSGGSEPMLGAIAPQSLVCMNAMDMVVEAAAPPMEPIEMLGASPAEGASTQATYKIGQKVTVVADSASPSQFTICKVQLPMKTIFYCAPEVDSNVYRASRLTNASDYYLVKSANCSVFWDDSYIASAQMPSVAPGDAFNLFLGQTEKVQIKTNPPKHWIKSGGGLMGQKDKLYYERSVTVSNYESASVLMFLTFNLIESRDDEIKISLHKISDVLEISAPDDITILTSPKFPSSVKRLQWIYNPVTHNCIALLNVESQAQELVTFGTVIESPNGRVINIESIEN